MNCLALIKTSAQKWLATKQLSCLKNSWKITLLKILKEDGAKRTLKMMAIYIGKPIYIRWLKNLGCWKLGVMTLAHWSYKCFCRMLLKKCLCVFPPLPFKDFIFFSGRELSWFNIWLALRFFFFLCLFFFKYFWRALLLNYIVWTLTKAFAAFTRSRVLFAVGRVLEGLSVLEECISGRHGWKWGYHWASNCSCSLSPPTPSLFQMLFLLLKTRERPSEFKSFTM